MKDAASPPKFTNRLARESSPYLLQHQHNPVDWYPWGPQAFEASRAQSKPIFLSVGYSTCYWCHVMERQCFENEAIAKEMNDRFINIKVDREERPDVDQLYMTAVQVLTRHGGWPMSVWLTPDLRPFYGGTYFPPEDAHGRPGFPTVLRGLDDAYRTRRDDVEKTATQLAHILDQLAEPSPPESPIVIDDKLIDHLVDRSIDDYDPTFGGFGSAPKFPRETLLELLLMCAVTSTSPQKAKIQRMVLHALDALAAGGIRDHLGGGFHRYSTDAKWLVPHFEIMLYDNAMLAWCFVEAYRQTEDRRYADVARGVFDFVLREMTAPDGPFYTAFDAEVDGQEGLNYLWTADEIERVLGSDDAKVFNRVYGVDRGPNFADPHHPSTGLGAGGTGTPDKNILYLATAMESGATSERIGAMRQKLYEARKQRKQPLLDTKVLTSWNALMIRAFAYGGQILGEQRYLDAAAKAATFLLQRHRMPDGGLFRTSRDGSPPKYNGFLDDYALLAQALLALHDAGAGAKWKQEVELLADVMRRKFGDEPIGGFYFTDESASDLIVRQKIASDSPLPSGNAVAAMVNLALGKPDVAQRVIGVFAEQLRQQGEGMSSMVLAMMQYVRAAGPFTVQAAPDSEAALKRPGSAEQTAHGVVALEGEWLDESRLAIHLNVRAGFHINAHEPSAGLIGTDLSITGDPARHVTRIDYPLGELRRFAFAEEPIRVYEGSVTIGINFDAPPSPKEPMRLALTYQACDDSACFPPVKKGIELRAAPVR